MANSLIIVESPAKVKTISKFLGNNYTIDATMGHLIDMPKSSLGVDIDNDYEPRYITIRGKGEMLSKLKREAKRADKVYLATDPDREGEAISWHLSNEFLKDQANKEKISRISFNEITKGAVKNALKHPRTIDMDLVDAQQARRVMDRLVGYTISPLLWKKIKKGLSAGRVQSVALRLISEREAAIAAFVPEEYWTLTAELLFGRKKLKAAFYGRKDQKISLSDEKMTDEIIGAIENEGKESEENKGQEFEVIESRASLRKKNPPLPFTTSTLQQEASKQLSFPTKKTMQIAQSLYEGVSVKGHGTLGLITYLRTDSTRISNEAEAAAKDYITEHFGENYLASSVRTVQNDKIQDAHEAIRPTDLNIEPSSVKDSLKRDEYRLYKLIYERFLSSRMEAALYDVLNVKLSAGEYVFTMSGSKLKFDGFLSVYHSADDKDEKETELPDIREGMKLHLIKLLKEQHFTAPPAHFTEASLVKVLEEDGIGRPSTYSPTISTLLNRRYITREKKNLYITELGMAVNEMMVNNFPSIINTEFTAKMEQLLDDVAEGKTKWKTIIENFYPELSVAVDKAQNDVEKVTLHEEETNVLCDKCGRNMVVKYGPHGKFLACPGFPECKNTKPYVEYAGFICPACGAECVKKRSKKGRLFYSCSRYPECNFMSWNKKKEYEPGERKENEIMA